MIGALLSIKYLGKKSWSQSLIFWIVYLVATIIATSIISLGIIISAAVFILLAHYWYKFTPFDSLKLFAIAFIIDIILLFILFMVLASTGILDQYFENLFPEQILNLF